MDTLKTYLDNMFAALPQNETVLRAKAELYTMMEDKYEELKAQGKSEHEAIGAVISEFGDIEEIREALGIDGTEDAKKDTASADAESAFDRDMKDLDEELKDLEKELNDWGEKFGKEFGEKIGKNAEDVVDGIGEAIADLDIGGIMSKSIGIASQAIEKERSVHIPAPFGAVETLPAFQEIDVQVIGANVEIMPSDAYTITLSKDLEADVSVTEGGRLTVKEVTNKNTRFGFKSFRFGIGNGGRLRLTYPVGESMRDVEVRAAAGGVQILSMQTEEIRITSSAGNVRLAEVIADKAEIGSKAGNVKCENCAFKAVTLDDKAGEISLDKVKSAHTVIRTKAGNIRCTESALGELTAENSAGNVRIDQVSGNPIHLSSSVGNVKAILAGTEDDYAFDLRTTHGNVKVGGENCGTRYKTVQAEGKIPFTASGSMGNVKVEFV